MNCEKVAGQIDQWLKKKANDAKVNGFVVGVSGGVDSALVSMLCARTGLQTVLVELPILRKEGEISDRANRHCAELFMKFPNVEMHTHDLGAVLNVFESSAPINFSPLADANLRSRLRMCSLYMFANTIGCMVVGTGNKVEDFGVGFFTKYGDGGVDISPIGDLLKSEVRELAVYLGVSADIVTATPTDELWADTRSDEDQIGASYNELEKALTFYSEWEAHCISPLSEVSQIFNWIADWYNNGTTVRDREVMRIFLIRHIQNAHKMCMPEICELDKGGN